MRGLFAEESGRRTPLRALWHSACLINAVSTFVDLQLADVIEKSTRPSVTSARMLTARMRTPSAPFGVLCKNGFLAHNPEEDAFALTDAGGLLHTGESPATASYAKTIASFDLVCLGEAGPSCGDREGGRHICE